MTPTQAAMRIAPRTMLCATAFRAHAQLADARFEELRQLCAAAGDKASLAIGMAGLVIWLLRLRALLARARRDEAGYRDFRDRYRDMAKTLGFEGHIAWAEAMA